MKSTWSLQFIAERVPTTACFAQNCTGTLSMHAAQALDNAPCSARLPALVVTATCTLLRQCRLPRCLRGRQPHQQGSLRSRRPICFAACAGWLTVHVRQHPREVSPVSRGVMFQPLSGRLPAGLRLLPPPLPAALAGHLTIP